jgi:starvation-inducible DNA-binding protein
MQHSDLRGEGCRGNAACGVILRKQVAVVGRGAFGCGQTSRGYGASAHKQQQAGLSRSAVSGACFAQLGSLQSICKEAHVINVRDAAARRIAPLSTPNDIKPNAVRDISVALNILLADVFALYLKTKNFHWHMSGPHFRDYHLLLDEQSDQIFAITDDIAERVRKIGGTTLRSIGQVSRLQRVLDNEADYVTPLDMLAELRDDNRQLAANLRETHGLCDENDDVATASLIEVWIDEAERRAWFLFEATRVRGE